MKAERRGCDFSGRRPRFAKVVPQGVWKPSDCRQGFQT
jgi:hypothetical protein